MITYCCVQLLNIYCGKNAFKLDFNLNIWNKISFVLSNLPFADLGISS